jgi:inner membrane transporter RhtA
LGCCCFAYIYPAGVAWLRVALSALILVVLVRPGWAAWTGRPMVLAGMFGIVTALMNICFYEAAARLPLGTAVAIEFIGPDSPCCWPCCRSPPCWSAFSSSD